MTVQRHRIVLAAAACGAAALATPASAQIKWNEIPAPAGKEALARTYPAGYRTDVIDVPIRGNDGDLEYKIQMKAGSTVVYTWEVRNLAKPEEFYTEFHGHTEPVNNRGDLMFYEKAAGAKMSGSLIAPWQGEHGWYWQNKSDAAVVVRLRMAGFYDLIPGQPGQAVKE